MRFKLAVTIFIFAVISCILIKIIYKETGFICFKPVYSEEFTDMKVQVPASEIEKIASRCEVTPGAYIEALMATNNYELNFNDYIKDKKTVNRALKRLSDLHFEESSSQIKIYDGLMEDLKVFPVLMPADKSIWVNYIDSYGNARTYGGDRIHEGTDIMSDEDVPGMLAVVSSTDGTVTHMGWLELGGYRIGITSDNGIYYYYAHLDSYADGLMVGDTVRAGQLLGFMGNTGYGKEEGTKGKFPVHLHFGIYVYYNDVEMAVNPYYLLKNLEGKVLYINYDLCYNNVAV